LNNVDFIPNKGPKYKATFSLVSKTDEKYIYLDKLFSKIGKRIVRIDRISTYNLQMLYHTLKIQIGNENNGKINEKRLFHGTKTLVDAKGIADTGFEDRFWEKGAFGAGSYFADDVAKSNQYVTPSSAGECVIFWVKVLLGKIQYVSEANTELTSPGKGFHSVHAPAGTPYRFSEYIVYRYGQAMPYMMITYK